MGQRLRLRPVDFFFFGGGVCGCGGGWGGEGGGVAVISCSLSLMLRWTWFVTHVNQIRFFPRDISVMTSSFCGSSHYVHQKISILGGHSQYMVCDACKSNVTRVYSSYSYVHSSWRMYLVREWLMYVMRYCVYSSILIHIVGDSCTQFVTHVPGSCVTCVWNACLRK